MSQSQKGKGVIDYSKWDDIVEESNDVHIDVQAPFNAQIPSINTTNITEEEAARVKIPRSPRPLPAEPPVLASDGLLEPPPMNAPKGVCVYLSPFIKSRVSSISLFKPVATNYSKLIDYF